MDDATLRIGILLPDPRPDSDPFTQVIETVSAAADDGLASVWMSNIFGLDALTTLAVAGSHVPGIELGTGVVPTYPRHPVTLAQQALTTHAATGGRLALGIGLSHQVVIESMFGFSFDRPARHMDEYLSVLLPLVREGAVSFEGETVKAQATLSTPRVGDLPVLLAALAPRMLRMAGGRADGTVLWMTGPKTVREHIVPSVRAAATDAGRPAPRVVCALPVCVTDDVAGARERASKTFAVYGHLPSYRAMLDREGAADPADVSFVGDEDAVRAMIADVADAGATDFVAGEFGSQQERTRTRDLLRSLVSSPAPVGRG